MDCPHCGSDISDGKRSQPDHKRLFAVIRRAYLTWPEGHRFKPVNAEHLRAWLICASGAEFRELVATFVMPEGADEATRKTFVASLQATINGTKGKGVVIPNGENAYIVAPVSMSFCKMDQRKFSRLRDAITDIIEAELQCKVEELTKEAA